MPRIKEDNWQAEHSKKWAALDKLAKEAGFDDDAFANTEFCLMPFFERIVEECALIAERQGRNYSGELNEMAGCNASAASIRLYGKTINNE